MEEKASNGKPCHSDRSQRSKCLYYHEKSGRCTMDASKDTWQEKPAKQQTEG